ncbi:MAG: DUF2953 domain-containing protein [Candidatus Latescibacteria bacterium]|nr:DUF2953 domain-containing protein [Candidatus Latescibacterota bacterium]
MNTLTTIAVVVGLLLAGGVLFFIAALVIPTVLRVVIERQGRRTRCWVSIEPVGGLVGLGVGIEEGTSKVGVFLLTKRLFATRVRRGRGREEKKRTIVPEQREPGGEARRGLRAITLFKEPVIQLFRSGFHAVTLREFVCSGRFGFDNPATTGMVFGWLQLIRGALSSRKAAIAILPDFEQRRFDGMVSLVITVHILRIGVSMVRFLCHVIKIDIRRQ